jgi:hypothetical protein
LQFTHSILSFNTPISVMTASATISKRPIVDVVGQDANKKSNTSGMDDPTSGLNAAPIPPLLVKRLSSKAKLPKRGSEFAAGYDLFR